MFAIFGILSVTDTVVLQSLIARSSLAVRGSLACFTRGWRLRDVRVSLSDLGSLPSAQFADAVKV